MMRRLGIVGAGNIGSAIASRMAHRGWTVMLTSRSGGTRLEEVCRRTGALAASLEDISSTAPMLVLAVPFSAISEVAEKVARGSATVIDATNYYPGLRDSPITAIEGGIAESRWVADTIRCPVAKAFNSINFMSLSGKARDPGEADRIALPVAADDASALRLACELIDEMGFDAVPAGSLSDSWRQQPGTPAYCTDLSREELIRALDTADRSIAPARRDLFIDRMREAFARQETPDLIALSRETYRVA